MAMLQARWGKKSKMTAKAVKHAAGDPAPVAIQFTDNEDETVTINGVNKAGDVLDLSGSFTLTPPPVSDAPTIVSVDPPSGPMTFPIHGLKVGTANLSGTATQNAGVTPAVAPLTFTAPANCIADPNASGLIVVPGVPTPRP